VLKTHAPIRTTSCYRSVPIITHICQHYHWHTALKSWFGRCGTVGSTLFTGLPPSLYQMSPSGCVSDNKRNPRSKTSLSLTIPARHHSSFTGQMLYLTPNQPCQSTEGTNTQNKNVKLTKIQRGQLVSVQPSTDISTAANTQNTNIQSASTYKMQENCKPHHNWINHAILIIWDLPCISNRTTGADVLQAAYPLCHPNDPTDSVKAINRILWTNTITPFSWQTSSGST